jgi:hypothetical protein
MPNETAPLIDPAPTDPLVKHELMDRASVLCNILDVTLGTHHGLANGNLQEHFDRAEAALADLYEEAARIAFEP